MGPRCASVVLDGKLQIQDFTPDEFLGAFVERRISSVDDIDCVGGFLKNMRTVFLIVVVILLALLFLVFI